MPNINKQIGELKEKLADIEHQRWADWQKYMHSKLKYTEYQEEGKAMACYILDPSDYEHWERQIDTGYSELSEKEKDSDREQVDRYLPLIQKALANQTKEIIGELESTREFGNDEFASVMALAIKIIKEKYE